MRRTGLLFFFLLLTYSGVHAQVSIGDKGSISGLMYNDYYWVTSNHDETLEDKNGFWFRRIYLTYEQDLGGAFSTRLRLEMANEGDFESGTDMAPFVKDAYLKWENNQHEILAGISSTPAFGLVEDMWAYRAVEKTPLDLHRLASSRDFGIAAKGTLDSDEKWGYHAMLGNGQSNSSEINPGKKVMLALHYNISDNWVVEAYGDWNSLPDEEFWVTLQGFAGYQNESTSAGLLYAHQYREGPMVLGPDTDYALDLASFFVRSTFSENTSGFFRIDRMFDPNPDGGDIAYIPMSAESEPTFIVVGVDYTIESDIHLIPNIETVFYGETAEGTRPTTDLIPRLTLFFRF